MPVDMWYNISKQQLETIRTMNNKVLIEIFDKRGKTESGIIVPITSENVFVPSEGIVVKIPDGVTDIKVGDKVTRGQVIGQMGNTGVSYGCHCHLGIFYGQPYSGGYSINPLSVYR